MSKYKIIETKVRTVEINDTLTLIIPFDLEITDDWLDSQMENINLSKCINYLENLGFVLINDKWCYNKKESIEVILEDYFINKETSSLLVEFGVIYNCSYLKLPHLLNGYCSLKEFPTFENNIPEICISRERADKYDNEYTIDSFILGIYSLNIREENNRDNINLILYDKLTKFINIQHEDLIKYYKNNLSIFEKDPHFKKIFKNNKIINKFKL